MVAMAGLCAARALSSASLKQTLAGPHHALPCPPLLPSEFAMELRARAPVRRGPIDAIGRSPPRGAGRQGFGLCDARGTPSQEAEPRRTCLLDRPRRFPEPRTFIMRQPRKGAHWRRKSGAPIEETSSAQVSPRVFFGDMGVFCSPRGEATRSNDQSAPANSRRAPRRRPNPRRSTALLLLTEDREDTSHRAGATSGPM